MRVLVIGYPLPDGEIDNYSVLTAPSYSDYDALVIDPASITRDAKKLIDGGGEFEAHDGRPIVNAPTSASAVSAADQIRRRTEETRRLLEAGGSVIVLAKPNAVQAGVVGFEGCDRYSWLPAPGGLNWGTPYLRAAEGKTIRIVAEDHPLSSLLRDFRNETAYRATLDDRQPELRAAGRVLAHGGSGIPIAMEFPLLGGRVVLIPAFGDTLGPIRGQIATGVVNLCRALGGASTGEDSPYWSRVIVLPGLEQAEAELETATAAASETQARLDAARERHDSLTNHRRILWDTGRPFEQAIVEALRMAGFGVTGGFGEPLELTSEGKTALLEVESGFSEVVEWPYVRLQRRLEERLLKTSEQLKGVVIVNGQRQTSPDSRGEQFTAQLRIACENYQYALITAETVFGLVLRILAGADESTLIGVRRRILGGAGLLSATAVLEGVAEAKDAGPIF